MQKTTGVPASFNHTETEPFVEKWLGRKEYPEDIARTRQEFLTALERTIVRPTGEGRFSNYRLSRSTALLEAFLENIAANHPIRGNNRIIRWWRSMQKERAINRIDLMREDLSIEIMELVERQRLQYPPGRTLNENLDYMADKILSSLIGTSYRRRR